MLLDRVLVRISPEDGERRSTGGIVIPATAQVAKRLSWGDVLGVGNNVRMVKVGDRVLFNPDDQQEVEIQGEAYLVMRERDIHALATERTGSLSSRCPQLRELSTALPSHPPVGA